MKISYAIPVCNELKEIQKLLGFLFSNKNKGDEIVILYDTKNGTKEVENFLDHYTKDNFNWFKLEKSPFDGHFANMKNKLTELCSGDYIFQIDADEMVSKWCLENLGMVLQYNPIDVLLVPRINTVKGLTQEHINKWRWKVDNEGRVNFPDFQWRIYKNNSKIKWKNKVHEVLQGYETISELPLDKPWCLIHEKTIERQEKQNNYYNTII
jgi:GT2 family glycosyltransferase